jgi:hypothetical protein
MPKVLADYQLRLDQILKEQAGDLDPEDKSAAIQNAVSAHSKYKPRSRIHDFNGDGAAFDFLLSGAAGFEVGFSKVLSVEFPAGERVPVYLEDEDWTIYEAATETPKLRLLAATPGATEKVRVRYTVRHSVDAAAGTIPDGDFEAVGHYAAHFALDALANRYTQTQDSTIQADSVDHRSKSQEARSNANKEEGEYFQHLGIKPGDVGAAIAFKDYDVNYPWGGDRLTHPRRER